MNSSGIKRGLAASAIAALAVTGVPAIASATPLAAQEASTTAVTLRTAVDGGTVSVKNDGTNNTISLVATAGSDVEFVSFFVGTTRVGTVGPSANGEFQLEWTPTAALFNTTQTITARASDSQGTAASLGAVVNANEATGVTISGSADTVELLPRAQSGFFAEPGTAAVGPYQNQTDYNLGINGTTSKVGAADTVSVDAAESLGLAAGGTFTVDAPASATATTTTWSGIVTLDKARIDASETDVDQVLPVVQTGAAATDTHDAQGFTVYRQVISNITATAGPLDGLTNTATVTVRVTDQNGQPIAGAHVGANPTTAPASAGTAVGSEYTNGNGIVRFSGATAGSFTYYVDATNQAGFTNGFDRSATVNVAASRPDSISFESKDGVAFDRDEYETGDTRVLVKDAAGNVLNNQTVFYSWSYTPFAPRANTNVAKTFSGTATTDTDGYANIPVPQGDGQTVGLNNTGLNLTTGAGTGGSLALTAYVNRDNSAPGQDAVDLGLPTQTLKVGESTATFDGPATTDRQQGTTQNFTGKVRLQDGTALAGRTVTLGYTAAGNSGFATTQPSGTTRLSNATATAITGEDGSFSVAITDPTAPAADELNNSLSVDGTALVGTAPNTRNGIGTDADAAPANTPLTINFRLDAVAKSIVLVADSDETITSRANGPDGLPNTADDIITTEADPYNELIGNVATPGRPVSFRVRLTNSTGAALAGQQVTLKTSNGFFTANPSATGNSPTDPNLNGVGALTAVPAPAEGGETGRYQNLGDSITVTTDSNGIATATVAIERDAGFDDDGQVTASVSATSGDATNTGPIAVTFTSADALNPGEVVVEAAANQAAGIELPEARVGQQVRLNVFAKDQFGNLTADQVVLSDNTADAGFAGQAANGTVTVTSQFTSSAPVATAIAQDDTTQTVTATWNQATNTYTDGNAAQAGFQPSVAVNNTNVETDTADPIEWYAIDFATSTFTLTSDPDGTVPVGTAVTETVRVIDQKGNPVQGLSVQFIRQGPAGQDGDPNIPTQTTNVNGEAFYSFTGTQAGTARVSAVVSDGVQNKTVVDTVDFAATTPDPIVAKIAVSNRASDGFDKIVVTAPAKAAGARVDLFKINKNGKARRVKSKPLNAAGKVTWVRPDLNGNKVSRYYAIVRATANTKADQTPTKGVK